MVGSGASVRRALEPMRRSVAQRPPAGLRIGRRRSERSTGSVGPDAIDPLTGLPNRAAIHETLRHRFDRSGREPMAVMFLDLNGFKLVNDSYGHDVGDRLLVAVADRLRQAVRTGDTIGRLGGDEFLVVTQAGRTGDDALALAHRIEAAVCQPFELGGMTLHPGVSIGLAVQVQDTFDGKELIKAADLAMYEAKTTTPNGRPRIAVATARTGDLFERRRRIAADFDEAWRGGQIGFHYQPVRRVGDLEVLGAEAFLRWNHPDLGPIRPDEALGVACSPEQVVGFTRWTLQTVGAEWMALRHRYPRFGDKGLSFNVDSRQILLADYLDMHLSILGDAGLRREDVIVEIQDWGDDRREEVLAALHGLNDADVPVALDYFGVTYNALEYLQHVPLVGFKIDSRLTRPAPGGGAHAENASRAIVAGLIETTSRLGILLLAEGVEDEAQLDACTEFELACMQGYVLGRPRPIHDFESIEREVERLQRSGASRGAVLAALADDDRRDPVDGNAAQPNAGRTSVANNSI